MRPDRAPPYVLRTYLIAAGNERITYSQPNWPIKKPVLPLRLGDHFHFQKSELHCGGIYRTFVPYMIFLCNAFHRNIKDIVDLDPFYYCVNKILYLLVYFT